MGFFKKVFKGLKKIVKKVAPIALPIAGSFLPGVGTAVGAAIGGAAGGVVSGKGFKGALLGAGLGYAGASFASKFSGFLPGTTNVSPGINLAGNIGGAGIKLGTAATGGAIGTGVQFSQGAINGAFNTARFLPSIGNVSTLFNGLSNTAVNVAKVAQAAATFNAPAVMVPTQQPAPIFVSSESPAAPSGAVTTTAVEAPAPEPVKQDNASFSNNGVSYMPVQANNNAMLLPIITIGVLGYLAMKGGKK